jgi:hypothetical protein
MSLGFRADPTNTSAVISVAGTDQVVITNASNVVATTFTGALVGNATSATNLATTTGAAPVYGVRAWVCFDGTRDTSGTVNAAFTNRFIYGNGAASGNVTGVLKTATGSYTISFSTAMTSTNYAVIGSTDNGSSVTVINVLEVASLATGSCSIVTAYAGGGTGRTLTDKVINSVYILG